MAAGIPEKEANGAFLLGLHPKDLGGSQWLLPRWASLPDRRERGSYCRHRECGETGGSGNGGRIGGTLVRDHVRRIKALRARAQGEKAVRGLLALPPPDDNHQ